MNIKTIDLYKKFNIERQQDKKGIMQCYLPQRTKDINKDRTYPAILILPGGGYEYVSPREAEPIALRYLAKGYAAFILDYSVSPCKYPTALLEAAMAMIHIRENAEELAIDANKVAALGFSAGGHLCGCLATLFDDEVIHKAFGDKAKHIRPDAVVLSYPVITSTQKAHKGSFDNLCGDDNQLRRKLSLETRVTKHSSPAFVWHTYEDGAVPVKNSLLLVNAYEENGVPFTLHIFEKGSHGLSTADWGSYATDELPDVSTGLASWIDMSVNWLNDRGIKLKD